MKSKSRTNELYVVPNSGIYPSIKFAENPSTIDDFSYKDAFLIPIVALWSDIIRRSLVGLRALIPFYSILVNDPVYVISSVTNDICRSSNYPWNNVFNS